MKPGIPGVADDLPRTLPGPALLRPLRSRIPRATYRLQLHAGFRFTDATAIVPYLADLGISHVYCSPYLRARSGSTHGYDIVDHQSLNPEIGSRHALATSSGMTNGGESQPSSLRAAAISSAPNGEPWVAAVPCLCGAP